MSDLALLAVHGDEHARGARDDLAVNVVPGGPPAWLRTAIAESLDELGAYPEESAATAAVAARHGRDPGEVVLLSGAVEGFWLLAHALRPPRAACVHPSFTEPERALRAAGAVIDRVLLDGPGYALDPAAIPDASPLVVLGNPTNPTGVLHPRAAVAGLCRPDRVTVVDEAFMDLVPGEPETLTGRADLPGLIVIRSLTKLWSIPGLRAGYALAPPALAARLRAARGPWPLSAPALAAVVATSTISARDEADRRARAAARARADLTDRLAALSGVTVTPGARANFVLLRSPRADLPARLRADDGIAVRPAESFPGLDAHHLRVAVRDAAEHARLHAALARLLPA